MGSALVPTVRLQARDRAALAAHFLALGREDRRLRFGSGVSDEALRDYAERIDFGRDGVFAVLDESGRPIAVVHAALGGAAAELGLSVLPGHRGRGLGNALFGRALTFLRNRRTTAVLVHCLSENAAMRHLARKHGMRVTYSGGESDARLELAAPTVESWRLERFEDWRAQAFQAS